MPSAPDHTCGSGYEVSFLSRDFSAVNKEIWRCLLEIAGNGKEAGGYTRGVRREVGLEM